MENSANKDSLIKKGVDWLRNTFVPRGREGQLVLQGLGKGTLWSLVVYAVSAAISTLYYVASNTVATLDTVLRGATFMAINASGANANLNIADPTLTGAEISSEVALRPTLITLVLVLVAFFWGRRSSATGEVTEKRSAVLISYGAGLGYAIAMAIASFVSTGLFSLLSASATLMPFDLIDGLVTFTLIGASVWMGTLSQSFSLGQRTGTGLLRWVTSSLIRFAKVYSVVTLFAALIFVISKLIEPVFADSVPATEFSMSSDQIVALIEGLGVALLFLPTLMFDTFSIAAGAATGVSVQFTGADSSIGQGLLNALTSSVSLPLSSVSGFTYAWYAELIIIVAVAVVSLIAATSASRSLNFKIRNIWDFARSTAFIAAFGLALTF